MDMLAAFQLPQYPPAELVPVLSQEVTTELTDVVSRLQPHYNWLHRLIQHQPGLLTQFLVQAPRQKAEDRDPRTAGMLKGSNAAGDEQFFRIKYLQTQPDQAALYGIGSLVDGSDGLALALSKASSLAIGEAILDSRFRGFKSA